jgi:hypothetical protein
MSLERWVEYGWLRREPTSTGEIKDLWESWIVALRIRRSKLFSPDLRFIAAFSARSAPPVSAPLPSRSPGQNNRIPVDTPSPRFVVARAAPVVGRRHAYFRELTLPVSLRSETKFGASSFNSLCQRFPFTFTWQGRLDSFVKKYRDQLQKKP